MDVQLHFCQPFDLFFVVLNSELFLKLTSRQCLVQWCHALQMSTALLLSLFFSKFFVNWTFHTGMCLSAVSTLHSCVLSYLVLIACNAPPGLYGIKKKMSVAWLRKGNRKVVKRHFTTISLRPIKLLAFRHSIGAAAVSSLCPAVDITRLTIKATENFWGPLKRFEGPRKAQSWESPSWAQSSLISSPSQENLLQTNFLSLLSRVLKDCTLPCQHGFDMALRRRQGSPICRLSSQGQTVRFQPSRLTQKSTKVLNTQLSI